MQKLYRFRDAKKEYWETWENGDGSHTIHWGELGSRGESQVVRSSFFLKAEKTLRKEITARFEQGFHAIDFDEHHTLIMEYPVAGMGDARDLEKRHRLEERLNETLGWTGLGSCDGGSIGSGTMEVCMYVVDSDLAKTVIERDLFGTEFGNYSRIYVEDA